MTAPGQAATGQTIILTHPREPGKFSGTDDVDVEDWILMYERVSSHNRWDPTFMLANLDLYLKGTAKDWFDTNEDRHTSWDACKEELKALFGRSESRQLEAKNDLASRVQSPTESYVTYIQSVLSLCYKVDRQMSEEEKVGHVLKGIADDAFNLLLFKNCDKVDTLIAECRRFELAKSRRIAQKFTRLPNTAATCSCEDNLQPPAGQRTSTGMSPTPDIITRIVLREIEAIAPTCFPHDAQNSSAVPVPLIQPVVREELLNLGVQPSCSAARPINTAVAEPAAAEVATTSVGDATASTASSSPAQSASEGTKEMETEASAAVPIPATPPLPPGALLTPSAVAALTKGSGKGAKFKSRGPSPLGTALPSDDDMDA
ncbi:uncharacterized protein LOC144180200 [Haemaphysalis longicornis]